MGRTVCDEHQIVLDQGRHRDIDDHATGERQQTAREKTVAFVAMARRTRPAVMATSTVISSRCTPKPTTQ